MSESVCAFGLAFDHPEEDIIPCLSVIKHA